MPVIKWPKGGKEKKALEQYLTKLLALCEPVGNDQMQPLNGNWTEIDAHKLALIKQMGPLPDLISESQRLYFLSAALGMLIHRQKEEQTVEQFYEDMNSLVEGGKPMTVSALTFLNIDRRDAPAEFQIGDTKLVKAAPFSYKMFIYADKLAEKLSFVSKGDIRSLEGRLLLLTGYQYDIDIQRPKYAHGIFHIREDIVTPFERLRSLMNFAEVYGRRYSISSPLPASQSPFVTSPLWFFHVDGTVLDELLYIHSSYENPYRSRIKWSRWEGLPTFNKLLADLDIGESNDDSTFKDLIWKLLNLYQEGLDSTDIAVAFLHFWQILERCTCLVDADRSSRTDTIINRLKLLLSFPKLKEYPLSDVEESTLNSLGNLRHTFAHNGDFPRHMGGFYFQIIKRYADLAIGRLIEILPQIDDIKLLHTYYMIRGEAYNLDLATLEHAIALVKGMKADSDN